MATCTVGIFLGWKSLMEQNGIKALKRHSDPLE